jgi:hypothetical protein
VRSRRARPLTAPALIPMRPRCAGIVSLHRLVRDAALPACAVLLPLSDMKLAQLASVGVAAGVVHALLYPFDFAR